jgi:hypothetical protein
MVHQPTMSHAVSTAGAALLVWLWDRQRERPSTGASLLLGLCAGLGMCLRWQNGVLLLLPTWDVLLALRRGGRERQAALLRGLVVVAAAALGAVPQMAAWKTIYGEWLLRYPPHGADFLRLGHPFVLNTLFSSRHGLLSWTPVFWGGYLGYAWLLRHRPQLAGPLLPPLLAMTYVNMCSGDWWAGGSFSNRRFDSLLPLLAIGLAGFLEWARRALARHPRAALSAVIVPAVVWNLGVTAQVARGDASPARADFPQLVGGTARAVAEVAGSPPTWPASWLFAWQHLRPASQYDRAVGRYLFYRQNNLGGRIDLGRADDEAHLAEGWGARTEIGERSCRPLTAPSARVLAPLDVAEDLALTLTATSPDGPREVEVHVNGHAAGAVLVERGWTAARLRLPAALWRRELNDVVVAADGPLCVDALDFVRLRSLTADGGGAR